jgi:hypothetical protein
LVRLVNDADAVAVNSFGAIEEIGDAEWHEHW